ncbi:hypothetical protein DEAC_c32500 [Desulfosporosinus acididurans]|uniref:Uncharacterized protein n=1 Tax=Desulfosporosinus acididurans TaxID=476652 RepID=A0A0J1FPN4_9FIRM|nr:hypothetical protein [Desulfosporosinus acididurans]KLU64918.1 hypothetical protein DEAC_c32500 [Desulfosporosinus acididurans]
MQLDNWLFLFFNLTILLAFSGIVFSLFKSNINVHMLESTTSIERNQFLLRKLILIRFQKYLVIKRMLKQENDDASEQMIKETV